MSLHYIVFVSLLPVFFSALALHETLRPGPCSAIAKWLNVYERITAERLLES
jgi:hypothetical protein